MLPYLGILVGFLAIIVSVVLAKQNQNFLEKQQNRNERLAMYVFQLQQTRADADMLYKITQSEFSELHENASDGMKAKLEHIDEVLEKFKKEFGTLY